MSLGLLTRFGLTRASAAAPATAPTVVITSPADLADVNSPVTVEGTISDDVGVTSWWYTVNGGAAQDFTLLQEPTALPDDGNGEFRWNSSPSIQDNVTTVNGVQYVVWVNDAKKPMIAKRTLPDGAWSSFDLSTVSGNPLAVIEDDLHNTLSVAVDSAGYVHVIGNLSNSPLRYVKSTSPGDITAWAAGSMVGSLESDMTYPKFIHLPSGALLFTYRDGGSGNGDQILNTYNTGTSTWSRVAKLIDGKTDSLNPYLWHVAVDWSTGAIHAFYCWRDTLSADSNHDLCYATSTDGGSTWKESDGTTITLPITKATSEVVVDTAGTGSGLMNAGGAEVDSSGRPHAAYLINDGGGDVQINHIYFNGTSWVDTQVTSWATAWNLATDPDAISHPSLFTVGARVFIPYRNALEGDGTMRCLEVTPGETIVDFKLVDRAFTNYHLSFDTRAFKDRDELHFVIADASGTDEAKPIAVASIDLTDIDELVAGTWAYA